MIKQYSNTLYPMDLFVGTFNDIPYCERNFIFYASICDLRNDEPIDNAELKVYNSNTAVTYIARHKRSGIRGVLILLNMEYLKEGDYCLLFDVVSHECSHAVDATY